MKISKVLQVVLSTMVLFLNIFYAQSVWGDRVVINKIEELDPILKKATTNSMVIFDVDEVLVYPKNVVQLQLAAHFWEASMKDLEARLGKTTRDQLHSVMLLQSHWALTDEKIPEFIQDLQSRNVRVIALTAFKRGKMGKLASVEDWRNDHLKTHRIDFNKTAGVSKSLEIVPPSEKDLQKKPLYKEGIIYTDLVPKGEVLGAFLKQSHLTPKEIIFIDDRLSNLQTVEDFCKSANIKFTGVLDNRIMNKGPAFNEALGKYQFEYLERFQVWLDDSEAAQKMADTSSGA